MLEHEVREKLVGVMVSFIGANEADGSHKKILDIYNNHKPLARGYVVKPTDAWCATGASAAAIKAGLTDIVPTECGCEKQIELWKKMGRWQEDGRYVPKMGDYIYYNWDDKTQPNTGHADHVGIVEEDSDGKSVRVVECNKNDRCERRVIAVGWGYIRGYGLPDYASKADNIPITPEVEDDADEENSNTVMSKTPKYIARVTAYVLNVRTWAGVKFPQIKSFPTLQKGNRVEVCDSIMNGETQWAYVRIDNRVYGFVSMKYLEKVEDIMHVPDTSSIKIGSTVQYNGSVHFSSSYAKATHSSCKPGVATVTAMNLNGSHQYHLVAVKGKGSTVYGWVDAEQIKIL